MPFRHYDQNQSFLFPPHLHDWVTDNHPARVFSDLIDKLPVAGFKNAAVEGRPRYDTRMMLKVLLWAYASGIRASRKIEERLRSDVVFMWLSGRQTPDFRTICDFRRSNEAAIDRLFAEVLVLAKALGLIRLGLLALDGTKVRASAGVKSFKTVKKWREALGEARKKVAEILAAAEAEDQADDEQYGRDKRGDELPEELANARERVAKIEQVLAAADENTKESLRLSSTDTDARFMHTASGSMPAFNGQVVVTEDQFIVYADVTTKPVDVNQLQPALAGIERTTGEKPDKLLADAGYRGGPNLRLLEEAKVDGYLPETEEKNIGKDKRNYPDLYGKTAFRYDKEQDCYVCPAGQVLRPKTRKRAKTRYSGSEATVYKPPRGVCLTCPQRDQCTKVRTKAGRTITRDDYEEERLRMRQKLTTEAGRAIYAKRKCTVEPTIGQLKIVNRLVQFLLRGIMGAKLEFKWGAIAHNLMKLVRKVSAGEAQLVPAA
jgi:transposase